ncbi:MAG: 3-oxoacid CoA-transferase [Chloroflexi bacterium]|nr:3-oxoacid CoA-transferase [Chloroflexota bacterium]
MARPKICATMAEAVADIPDGITLLVPGFGVGTPLNLLTALYHQGAKGMTLVQNGQGNASTDARVRNSGNLIEDGRVKKVIASFTAATHPSRVSKTEQMVRDGLLDVELVPQGTVAERIRAGGAGIPAFYTPAGVGTLLSEGKEHREFNGRSYVLEEGIVADYAFIHAWKADTAGNLIYRHGARNYNPIAAMAGRHTIVEVEEPIVEAGMLEPDEFHTPGIYVARMVQIPPDGILRPIRPPAPAVEAREEHAGGGKRRLNREQMAAAIGRHFRAGSTVNLGIGIPTLASGYTRDEDDITFTSENGVIGYGRIATPEEADPDVWNAGGQQVTLRPGASFVNHADSFALIRGGNLDVTVLGAYEAAADGSFANWRLSDAPFDNLGGIGGAMDLVASAKEIWLAMEHTTRDGKPRLLQTCTLPVTSPGGVTLIVTDLAVIAVRAGQFILEEYAPGYTPEEIAAVTGAPLQVSPTVKEIAL